VVDEDEAFEGRTLKERISCASSYATASARETIRVCLKYLWLTTIRGKTVILIDKLAEPCRQLPEQYLALPGL
jgi:hypothetical protein